jgi:ABC-type transport system involved in cytochrome bd biosynthesis fused ATPase/permease subunit
LSSNIACQFIWVVLVSSSVFKYLGARYVQQGWSMLNTPDIIKAHMSALDATAAVVLALAMPSCLLLFIYIVGGSRRCSDAV